MWNIIIENNPFNVFIILVLGNDMLISHVAINELLGVQKSILLRQSTALNLATNVSPNGYGMGSILQRVYELITQFS